MSVVAVRLLHWFWTSFLRFLAPRSSPPASSLDFTPFDSSTTDASHSSFPQYSQHMKTGLRDHLTFFPQKLWCTPMWCHSLRCIYLPLMVAGLSFDSRLFIIAFGFLLNWFRYLITPKYTISVRPANHMCFYKWLSIQIFLPTLNSIYSPQLGSRKTLGKCNLLFCSVIDRRLQLQVSSKGVLSALLNPAVPAVF